MVTDREGPSARPTPVERRKAQQAASLIRVLRERVEISRPELVEGADAPRELVKEVVAQLEKANIVDITRENPDVPKRGRPPDVLRVRHDGGYALGIDFGHRHIRGVLRGLDGELLPKPAEQPWFDVDLDVDVDIERALTVAEKVTRQLLRSASVTPDQLVGMTVSVPAPVRDPDDGDVAFDHGMQHWRPIKPGEELIKRLGWDFPVYTGNDANLGALAELRDAGREDEGNALYIKWSTGIGSAVVLDGEVRRGHRGYAGELGHLRVPEVARRERRCERCGSDTCLEIVAGGAAVTAAVNARLEAAGEEPRAKSLIDVIALARDHGPVAEIAEECIADAARALGRVLAQVLTLLNPYVVILGGQMAKRPDSDPYPLVAPHILGQLRSEAFAVALEDFELRTGGRPWASAEGAALYALDRGFLSFAENRLTPATAA